MNSPKIYDRVVILVSKELSFDIDLVQECFEESLLPTIYSDKDYEALTSDITTLKSIRNYMVKIDKKYKQLSDILRAKDKITGNKLKQSLNFSSKQIEADLELLEREIYSHSRQHGANPNAQFVANFIALIFHKEGKKLTVGMYAVSGEPSTEFSRAVKKAFEILLGKHRNTSKIVPHWRRYAKEARDRVLSTSGW